MASIERISLPAAGADLWPTLAAEVQGWLAGHGLPAQDAVLLLPFAALLAPARAALALQGGWQPRVETALTLAAALAPPVAAVAGACCGETVADRLGAATLLRGPAWAAAWERTDPAGFARIVAAVVEAAQALRTGAFERAPEHRAAYWAEARAGSLPLAGPAATEGALLRLALEWAAEAPPPATDRLFAHRPAAWIALRLGGPDALAEALLGRAEVPSLQLLADPPDDAPFAPAARAASAAQASPAARHAAVAGPRLERLLCDDFEAEAQAAACAVIDALNAGRTPVALVALDRELLRRVRALLARAQVPVLDETGWRLDTTRAAADVLSLLQAARPQATADSRLDWLKTLPDVPAADLDTLEALWRGRRHPGRRDRADALWNRAQALLRPLAGGGRQPLAAWLAALEAVLRDSGVWDRLTADAAGQQLLAALGFGARAPWQALAESWVTDAAGCAAWVESTLGSAAFLPPPDADAPVVLTPLARAFGRPFAEIVVPGADERRLGRTEPAPSLLGDALAARLGLDHAAARRQRQRLALAQLLRAPRLTLLRRRREDDEPLGDSPDVEWLLLAHEQAGAGMPPLRDWQPSQRRLPRRPVPRPQPCAPDALPAVLSASQLEALRQCPYRFYVRTVLGLDEPEELDAELVKRDYGTWLHAALHHFHSRRDPARPDALQLDEAADAATRALALDEADLLPYRAGFEALAPAYLAWLGEREALGWRWQSGETDHDIAPPALGGLRLRGRIDRLDLGPGGARALLDYKTGSAQALVRRVKQPLEDTQLAFYAALLGGDERLTAAYLALDDADAPREIEHLAVHRSAAALLPALADEWARLRQGAPMPALGEGAVCDTCEARGLCRRDHWAAR
ncbi:MAG: PD-(D/E)XK nuclease family protein [Burkholderiales bacterium]|nr:PD-(D/E)XK nuclease family protein [Burkholderiales bacterium]